MLHFSVHFYEKLALYTAVFAGYFEAVKTPGVSVAYIFGLAAGLAALGGFASALRESRTTRVVRVLDVASSVINMSALGASVSMFSLWMLNGETTQTNAVGIIGLCGILGLAGEPLLTPLVSFIYEVARRFFPEEKK
jgi:hypothetical protein